MAVTFRSITGRVSALALALATLSLPVTAQAQEEGRRFRDRDTAANVSANNADQRAARSARTESNGRGWQRPDRAAPQAAPAAVSQQQVRTAPPPRWTRPAPRGEANGWADNRRSWQSRDVRSQTVASPQQQAAPAPVIQGRSWSDGRTVRSTEARRTDRAGANWRQDRDRTHRDAARVEDSRWRDRNRQDYRRDNDRRWDNNANRNRYSSSQGNRHWDSRWRDNRRYDWYSYRRSSPSAFRIGLYYSPYRNYSYRRLSTGFILDALFFSNRYWINDPWQYRLPEAYGPYRWVRYYDDALLVDTYTGEVVDAIYSFFW